MNIKTMKFAGISSLITAAIISSSAVFSATSEDFTAAYDSAEALRKEAASVGFEWRDTGKILKSAKKAADAGDLDKAMKLSMKAQKQSEAALAQQKREADSWMSRVPK